MKLKIVIEIMPKKKNLFELFVDMPLLKSNGKRVGVEFVSNVCKVNDGKVFQRNFRDITQLKQIEAILRENEWHLKFKKHEWV